MEPVRRLLKMLKVVKVEGSFDGKDPCNSHPDRVRVVRLGNKAHSWSQLSVKETSPTA